MPGTSPPADAQRPSRRDGRTRPVGAVAPRQVGARASGDDHRIGAECLDHVRTRSHTQANVDAEAFSLRREMPHRVPDLAVKRLARCEPDEAAGLALPLEQGDAMAPPGEGHRSAQPGRASAHHRHMTGRRGGRQGAESQLLSRRRVQRAPDRIALRDLMQAGVAGDAGPHLAAAAVANLVGKLRVRNELARHADEVRIALPQDPFRVVGLLDPAEGDYRQRGRALERGVQVVKGELRHRRRRDLHPEAAECSRVGGEEIDVPARRERPGNLRGRSRGRSRTGCTRAGKRGPRWASRGRPPPAWPPAPRAGGACGSRRSRRRHPPCG